MEPKWKNISNVTHTLTIRTGTNAISRRRWQQPYKAAPEARTQDNVRVDWSRCWSRETRHHMSRTPEQGATTIRFGRLARKEASRVCRCHAKSRHRTMTRSEPGALRAMVADGLGGVAGKEEKGRVGKGRAMRVGQPTDMALDGRSPSTTWAGRRSGGRKGPTGDAEWASQGKRRRGRWSERGRCIRGCGSQRFLGNMARKTRRRRGVRLKGGVQQNGPQWQWTATTTKPIEAQTSAETPTEAERRVEGPHARRWVGGSRGTWEWTVHKVLWRGQFERVCLYAREKVLCYFVGI